MGTTISTSRFVSRRDLLKTGGALVVGFTFGAALPKRAAAQTPVANAGPANAGPGKPVDPREVDSFLAVHADGSVTVYTGKVDVGTGLRSAVRQMAAEELGVSFDRVALVEGDTALCVDQGGTGGSTGLTRGGVEVRQAAATARQGLIALGAAKLNRPAAELTIVDGEVRPAAGGQGIGIGALLNANQAGEKGLSLKVDPKAPLQSPATYTVVGKPMARPDVPAKCTGRHVYIQDLVLPGMLHGRVVRPPAIGAKLMAVDESSIRDIPDVRVVRIENFLAVVSKDEWAAVRAAKQLKATWTDWKGLPGDSGLDRYLREGAVDKHEVVATRGDSAAAMPTAVKKLSASYWWPCQSHASLGPSCAVADMRADGLTLWSASQGTHGLRVSMSKLMGVPVDKVRVIYLDGAGSYGGNGNDDVAADAVLLSKTVGAPVRVQWMRQEEHGWDPKGPQQLLDLRAGLDADGHIAAWETEMWLPTTVPGGRPYLAFDAAGIPQDHGQGAGQISQNGDPPYKSPNVKVTVHWLKQTPLRPSNLRAPGKIANVFAVEGFVDELAVEAGIDPLEYRLRDLTDPRAIEVLKRATDLFKWEPRTSPNRAARGNVMTGRGLAYMRYKQAENYVATAMEVAVDRATGRVAVRRVACAHDCGLVVNPDALRNQIEGQIVQTISRALHEEVKFDQSRVTSVDWVSYPILRMQEVPTVEVALVNHPELPLYGAGEAAAAPVAAALANAIFDATGIRLRSVPFTADRLKAALTSA